MLLYSLFELCISPFSSAHVVSVTVRTMQRPLYHLYCHSIWYCWANAMWPLYHVKGDNEEWATNGKLPWMSYPSITHLYIEISWWNKLTFGKSIKLSKILSVSLWIIWHFYCLVYACLHKAIKSCGGLKQLQLKIYRVIIHAYALNKQTWDILNLRQLHWLQLDKWIKLKVSKQSLASCSLWSSDLFPFITFASVTESILLISLCRSCDSVPGWRLRLLVMEGHGSLFTGFVVSGNEWEMRRKLIVV